MNSSSFHTLGDWAETGAVMAIVLALDVHGRALIQFRDDFPHVIKGGYWSLFGGHVDPGETIHDAVSREASEELGLEFAKDAFKPFARILTDIGHRHYVYRLTVPVDVSQIRLGEGAGFAAIHAEQMKEFRLLDGARAALEHHFAEGQDKFD